jgi:hypothetical protein
MNEPIDEEASGANGALGAVWRPAGMIYLVAMLIGLAVGLWPGSVRGSGDLYSSVSVRAVGALVVAQVGFFLLIYPLIVLFRAAPGRSWRWWPDAVVEILFWAFAGSAFFVPAVWLSTSVPFDAIRGAVYVCGLWPMAWVCGLWLASGKPGGSLVMLISVFSAIGLPWLWYVSAEFFPGVGWSDTLWMLCPATHGWDVSAPNGSGGGLEPVWATLVWPVVAVAMWAIWMIVPDRAADA